MRALFIVAAMVISTTASAHEWYPTDCCSQRDCRSVEVTAIEIEIRPGVGYYIILSGELIRFGDPRIREFPPSAAHFPGALDHFHRCSYDNGNPTKNTICLFVPRGAF